MNILRRIGLAACILASLYVTPFTTSAQEPTSIYNKAYGFPDKFFGAVQNKSDKLQRRLERSTEKHFKSLAKKELRLKRALAKKDPMAAKRVFGDVNGRYDSLRNIANSPMAKLPSAYSGHLDSMRTALSFFETKKILGASPEMSAKVQAALKNYGNAQGKLDQAQFLQNQIKERQQYLQSQLKNFGLAKELNKYKEQAYYYRAQVNEHKDIFEHPKKLEAAALRVAKKLPSFRQFFNKHSQLASLFRLPEDGGEPIAAIPGLQTRAMVTQSMDDRLGSGANVNQYMSSSMQAAQSGLSQARKKLKQLGSSGSDLDMPNFQPNNQKSKSFLKRLELGTNIQSAKSNSFFPVTTDIGISLGYKFSPKAIAGIGSSYKMGLGRDIKHIAITHQGLGLRAFADFKLKGSFWISGGAETNYRSTINNFEQLKDNSDWQRSALMGISKKYKVSNKLKGNLQLLYDLLYRSNFPVTQPVVFRTGYSF